jgi:hypothetical protein
MSKESDEREKREQVLLRCVSVNPGDAIGGPPIFSPWTYNLVAFDEDWNEIRNLILIEIPLSRVVSVFRYWEECQKARASGVVDNQNVYHRIALLQVEMNRG